MLHGGWPFTREIGALLTKPNAYLDFSAQAFIASPTTMAGWMREWLEAVPEKVMFATDAYPFMPEMGWEESGWSDAHKGRQALALALTGMLRDERHHSRPRFGTGPHGAPRQRSRAVWPGGCAVMNRAKV